HGGIPQIQVLLHRSHHDRREGLRNVGSHYVSRLRRLVQDLVKDGGEVLSPKRLLVSQNLVADDAERKHIGALIKRLTADLLGSEVGRRAERNSRLREARFRL